MSVSPYGHDKARAGQCVTSSSAAVSTSAGAGDRVGQRSGRAADQPGQVARRARPAGPARWRGPRPRGSRRTARAAPRRSGSPRCASGVTALYVIVLPDCRDLGGVLGEATTPCRRSARTPCPGARRRSARRPRRPRSPRGPRRRRGPRPRWRRRRRAPGPGRGSPCSSRCTSRCAGTCRAAGVEDQLLGDLVLGGQHEVGVGAAEDAGVGELGHARGLRRVDDRGVLRHAPADLAAGDQQHPVAGAEGPGQGGGLAVVGDAQLHAPRGERRRPSPCCVRRRRSRRPGPASAAPR